MQRPPGVREAHDPRAGHRQLVLPRVQRHREGAQPPENGTPNGLIDPRMAAGHTSGHWRCDLNARKLMSGEYEQPLSVSVPHTSSGDDGGVSAMANHPGQARSQSPAED